MGIFSKEKIEPEAKNEKNPYSAWNEQARVARNPDMLSPEELLGFGIEEEKKEETVSNFDTSEDNMKKLYERMLGKLNKPEEEKEEPEQISLFEIEEVAEEAAQETLEADLVEEALTLPEEEEKEAFVIETPEEEEETEEAPEEDITEEFVEEAIKEKIIQEPEIITEEAATEEEVEQPTIKAEEEPVKEKAEPKEDAFADFFRRLEKETAEENKKTVEKTAIIEESKSVEKKDELNEKEVEDVAALLKMVYSSRKELAEEEEKEETAEEIVKEFEKQVEKPFEEPSKKPAPVSEETVVFDSVDIEKTQVVDSDAVVTAAAHITPRHSLYTSERSEIDKKAIDDFFNNCFEEEEQPVKKYERKKVKKEAVQIPDEPEIIEEIEDEACTEVFNDKVEDYENLNNAAEIKQDIVTRGKRISFRLLITGLLTALMLFVNSTFFLLQNMDFGAIPNIINLGLLAITAAINYKSFLGLFSKDHDTDCVSSSVALVVLLQSIISVVFFGGAGAGLGAIAGLSLLISLVGKRAVCKATLSSINTIATNEKKFAVLPIEDTALATDIVGTADENEPFVCYGKKTTNVHGFLKNWYRPSITDKKALTSCVISLVVAMILSFVAYYVMRVSLENTLSVFTLAFSLCSAPTYFLINSISLKVMTDGLKIYDSAVAGFNGADVLSDCTSVVVSASDLFPAGSIILHNMMPLSANSVDKSIAKAAAVAIEADSPLMNIFKDIVRDSIDALPKAEDVKYENKLGISGWIGNELILIGNRTLMENHNVKTPSNEFDRKIMAAGYKPVYLACGGKPCLLFVVQYSALSDVKFEVQRLANTATTLVVDSTDPNITAKFIAEEFDLADNDVTVISRTGAAKLYKLNQYEENSNGFAAYKPKSSGILACISSSIRLRSIHTIMTALHIIGAVAGVVLLALMLYSKGFTLFTPLLALALEIVFVCLVYAVPYIKKP